MMLADVLPEGEASDSALLLCRVFENGDRSAAFVTTERV